ncbi:FtsW/RodA/SpoVE family cell cycle protein [Sediminitomix flava]|uniref:Probable peptidoglycan glycosyltransferase FtsW n=1 Tax=Sediminitomix flava TaxID=379075 RepID=A0A315ZB78_SEDFL|nr:FtsW/RodA/SpoVE family cell cycle protein [Sediminitomix flava]PWJ42068.1 cell division protein FtsW [Sediminitomix flava]
MKKLLNKLEGDKVIWAICILLALWSILVVYSATGSKSYLRWDGNSEHYLFKHVILTLLGLGTMYICHKIDYNYYRVISRIFLIASACLLLFAYFFGSEINSAARWIRVPVVGFTFQPSDIAKLALITNMASMLSKRQRSIKEFRRVFLKLLSWTGVICMLIGLTDFSTAALLAGTIVLLFFIGRVPVKYISLLVFGVIVFLGVALYSGQRLGTVVNRTLTYLDKDQMSEQSVQSHIALASGGFAGKGIGQSTQRNFLPLSYSDFIYAVIVEEYGFMGGVFLIFLYLVILWRGMITIAHSKRAFGGLLAAGLTFSVVIQAFVHICVVVGILPLTGLPLPFMSMGGTSLVFTGATLGIVLSVGRTQLEEEEESLPSFHPEDRGGLLEDEPIIEQEEAVQETQKVNTLYGGSYRKGSSRVSNFKRD